MNLRIDKYEPADDRERHWMKFFSNRYLYLAAEHYITEKLGPFPEDLYLVIFWDEPREMAATMPRPRGQGGGAFVSYNLKGICAYEQYINDLDMAGVPIHLKTRPSSLIPHELVHAWHGTGSIAPKWFYEGLACFVADDPSYLEYFRTNATVQDITVEYSDQSLTQARGKLFWLWLDCFGLVKRVANEVADGAEMWSVLESATKLSKEQIITAEREWSAQRILEPNKVTVE